MIAWFVGFFSAFIWFELLFDWLSAEYSFEVIVEKLVWVEFVVGYEDIVGMFVIVVDMSGGGGGSDEGMNETDAIDGIVVTGDTIELISGVFVTGLKAW